MKTWRHGQSRPEKQPGRRLGGIENAIEEIDFVQQTPHVAGLKRPVIRDHIEIVGVTRGLDHIDELVQIHAGLMPPQLRSYRGSPVRPVITSTTSLPQQALR
jgi:hypothetical protein